LIKADEIMMFAQNFNAKQGIVNGFRIIWSNRVGSYKYFAYILAGFDPLKAKEIWDFPAHEIAEAYVSKVCYEYVEPPK
jgi:hypothetical protein